MNWVSAPAETTPENTSCVPHQIRASMAEADRKMIIATSTARARSRTASAR